MQTRNSLHLYLIALIIAAIVIPFTWSRAALAQVEPAAADETNAQNLLLPAQQDTTLVQLQPSQNFGAQPTLVVGRQIGVEQVSSFETLVQWDLAALPVGTTINAAEIGLFQTGASAEAGTVLVNRVLTPWDEGKVTYGTRPETVIYDRTWSPPLNTGQYVFYQGERAKQHHCCEPGAGLGEHARRELWHTARLRRNGFRGHARLTASKRQTSTRRCCE